MSLFFSTTSNEKLFDKILIANRGEIAVRVIKSCQKLGIKTVAVYSEPDINSMAVKLADERVCIGPAASTDSYLNIPAILDAVKQTGAQAVHPGYGFLSENKLFAEALAAEGVEFIGPGTVAIAAMGDKIESKQLAIEAGVNTIPGFLGIMRDEAEVLKVSNDIGYPVMIKASAGGGGKGMRVAYNDEEAASGFRFSKEEAANSFGDDRIFIEKFIEDPRHIEIQLLADKHGNVVPFPERECSIQRRNQKVVEEAPSMLLTPATRQAMQDQTVMLAKAVQYHSAGTVEFLCDKHEQFYFLEMNTRLQVEHPVTELITKVDLVEQMIRIAAGHRLPKPWLDKPLPIHGWAMESRVYAEDPLRGFLPSIGRLLEYKEPCSDEATHPGVRVDSGVTEGSDISMHYDPMISKLITHGKDRTECRERMQRALAQYVIRGPGHNLSFLADLYRQPRFQAGDLTTAFIDEEYPEGFSGVVLESAALDELIVAGVLMHRVNAEVASQISGQVSTIHSSNAAATHATQTYYVSTSGPFGPMVPVQVMKCNNHWTLVVNGQRTIRVEDSTWASRGSLWTATLVTDADNNNNNNNNTSNVVIQSLTSVPQGYRLMHHGAIHDVIVRSPRGAELSTHMKPKPVVDTSRLLQCPMPGVLVSLAVSEGDAVQPGQELAVIEAMKMQNVMRAEKAGTIATIKVAAGASLVVDEIILEFE